MRFHLDDSRLLHQASESNSVGTSWFPGSPYPIACNVSYHSSLLEDGRRFPHHGQNRMSVDECPRRLISTLYSFHGRSQRITGFGPWVSHSTGSEMNQAMSRQQCWDGSIPLLRQNERRSSSDLRVIGSIMSRSNGRSHLVFDPIGTAGCFLPRLIVTGTTGSSGQRDANSS
jgi:hypothetical protein